MGQRADSVADEDLLPVELVPSGFRETILVRSPSAQEVSAERTPRAPRVLGDSAGAVNNFASRFADGRKPEVTQCVARRVAHLCCRQASRGKFSLAKGRVCLRPCFFAVRLLWREGRPHRKGTRHVGR